jgi:peptidoglycan/xylan/chitin deacetylase (PgdA/CDA1 family)
MGPGFAYAIIKPMKEYWKKNKHFLALGCLVTAALIFAAANEYLHYRQRQNTEDLLLNPSEQSFSMIVKPQDRAPLPIPPKARTIKVPILMYHHIGDPPPRASAMRRDLTVSAADFEQQAKWLHDSGFTSIRLNDIYLYSQGRFAMPKKPVVFTFDDGYDDVFINAIPILKQYGFTGSFGIITQYPHLQMGDNFYASWQEIAQAFAAGNEIVCHTQNHFDGTNKKYSSDYIFQNLSGCQNDIQNHLGVAEPVMIYPYGHYNDVYLAQARKVGMVLGATVHEGDIINLDDLMQLPRVRVHGHEDFERFKRLVSE